MHLLILFIILLTHLIRLVLEIVDWPLPPKGNRFIHLRNKNNIIGGERKVHKDASDFIDLLTKGQNVVCLNLKKSIMVFIKFF